MKPLRRATIFLCGALRAGSWASAQPSSQAPAPSSQPAAREIASAARGIAGMVEFRSKGPKLRAKPGQNLSAPLLARIAEAKTGEDGATSYRVEYLGAAAGDFDLRDCLEHEDGSPAADLPPMTVRIVSQLPPDHGTDVYGLPDPPFTLKAWYRQILIILGILWLLIPVIIFTRRAILRRPPPPPPPAPRAPTLADKLRPLLESARAGTMSTADRGRLELLLYQYFRDSLGQPASGPAEAIAQLRAHPQASPILLSVERWLHAPGRSAEPGDEVARLLAPFEKVALAAAAPQEAAV